jgi:hypothetical protein
MPANSPSQGGASGKFRRRPEINRVTHDIDSTHLIRPHPHQRIDIENRRLHARRAS